MGANYFWQHAIEKTCEEFKKDSKQFKHQWINSQWIYRNLKKQNGVVLGDSVGTGKTYSALFGALHLYVKRKQNKKHKDTSILIICPNKDVIAKWKRDLFQIDDNKPNLIDYVNNLKEGKHKKKIKQALHKLLDEENIVDLDKLQKKGHKENLKDNAKHKIIFATNRSIQKYFKGKETDVKRTLKDIIQIAIIDEAHKVKQPGYQEIINVEEGFLPNSKKILLTATPFQKETGEFKKLLKILGKEEDAKDFDKYRKKISEMDNLSEIKELRRNLKNNIKRYIAVTNKSIYTVNVFVNGIAVNDLLKKTKTDLKSLFSKLKEKDFPLCETFYPIYLKERSHINNADEMKMIVFQKLSLILSKPNNDNINEAHPKVVLLKRILKEHFRIDEKSQDFCLKPVIFAGMNVGNDKGLHSFLKNTIAEFYRAKLSEKLKKINSVSLPDFNKIIGKVPTLRKSIETELNTYAIKIKKGLEKSKLYTLYAAENEKIKKFYGKEFENLAKQYNEACLLIPCKNKDDLEKLRNKMDFETIDVEDFEFEYLSNFVRDKKKHLKEAFMSLIPGKNLVETYSSMSSGKKQSLSSFQNPLEPFALIVSNAGSESLDMQNYTKGCIHYDMAWSPGLMIQRNGRINRIGKRARKNLPIENHYLIIPNTYDERIFAALQQRMKALSLLIPIDIESKELFVNVDSKLTRNLGLKLEPRL